MSAVAAAGSVTSLPVLAGIEMTEAIASLPSRLDPDRARRLFTLAELAFVNAWNKRDTKSDA